jgi:hypothetical protein
MNKRKRFGLVRLIPTKYHLIPFPEIVTRIEFVLLASNLRIFDTAKPSLPNQGIIYRLPYQAPPHSRHHRPDVIQGEYPRAQPQTPHKHGADGETVWRTDLTKHNKISHISIAIIRENRHGGK